MARLSDNTVQRSGWFQTPRGWLRALGTREVLDLHTVIGIETAVAVRIDFGLVSALPPPDAGESMNADIAFAAELIQRAERT